jgi:hypothetical protein
MTAKMNENDDTRSVSSHYTTRSGYNNGSLRMARGRYPASENPSFSTSMGRFDTCILGREIVEPQKRHTV